MWRANAWSTSMIARRAELDDAIDDLKVSDDPGRGHAGLGRTANRARPNKPPPPLNERLRRRRFHAQLRRPHKGHPVSAARCAWRVRVRTCPATTTSSLSFTAAILEEAGKIAAEVLAPINAVGDTEGCVLENGVVRTPTGFRDRVRADEVPAAGPASTCPKNYGGQGMPYVLGAIMNEYLFFGKSGLCHVSGPDPCRRQRGSGPWHGSAKGHVSAENGVV